MQAVHSTRIVLAKQAFRVAGSSSDGLESVDFRTAAEGYNCLNCERDLSFEEEEAKEFPSYWWPVMK